MVDKYFLLKVGSSNPTRNKNKVLLDPRREVGDIDGVGTRRHLTLGELLRAEIRAAIAAGTNALPGSEPLPALGRAVRPIGPGRESKPRPCQAGVDDQGSRGLRAVRKVVAKLIVDILTDANAASEGRRRVPAAPASAAHAEVARLGAGAPLRPGGPLAVLGAVRDLQVPAVTARAAVGRQRAVALPLPADAVVAGGLDSPIRVRKVALEPR